MASGTVGQGAPPHGDARFRQLVAVLRQMRRRPTARAGDRLRPLLLTAEEGSWHAWVADRLVTDCRADGGTYARVHAAGTGADVADLLRDIAHQLSESHPRLEPPLRFQLLSMAMWLQSLRSKRLRLPPSGTLPAHAPHEADDWELAARLRERSTDGSSRRVLAAGIRSRRQRVLPGQGGQRDKLASVLTYLEQIAPIGVAVVALISATAASTLDLAAAMMTAMAGVVAIAGQAGIFTWDWAGRRRYRWFAEQRYGRNLPPGADRSGGGGGFLAFAVDLVYRPAPPAADDGRYLPDDDLDKLLVAAFLEDLRQAYRRSWRRVTWARVRYPAVIMDAYGEGAARRFVTLVEQVRAERLEPPRGSEAHLSVRERRMRDRMRPERVSARIAFDPLVIVACLGSVAEVRGLASEVRPKPLHADVADLGDVQRAYSGYWADRRRAIALGYARDVAVDLAEGDGWSAPKLPRRGRPWIAHPVMPWLVAGTVLAASVGLIVFQSVRYCDPQTVWHAANGECIGITDGSYPFSRRLASVENRIEQLNQDVIRSGKPYVSMVYLGPMTTDPATRNPQADLQAGVHGELAGLAIAQERHNSGGQPLLRILLANTGSRFRYAGEVAEHIRKRAVEDRTIVSVVGFGHSRTQTQTAINILSQAALPMVGTTNTYDHTGRQRGGFFSPYYFRLAPPNSRLAALAAHWARSGRLGSGNKRVTRADVFYEAAPDDLYSTNLAQDFATSFGRENVRMLPYTAPSQIPARVDEACENPAQVFYYAGRSDEFRSFINRLANTSCAGRRIVLAGDEVTRYVSDSSIDIGRTDSIRLYYTPLAARAAWDPKWVGDEPLQVFYSAFDPMVHKLVGENAPAGERPSLAHAAIGYDAARTIIGVAERISAEQEGALPTAAAVLSALTEPAGGAQPQGATGLLRFGPRSQGHQVPDKPVLLMTVRPDGTQEAVAVCGRLVNGAMQDEGCPRS